MFRANKPIRVNYCSTWFIEKVIFVQIAKNVQLLPPDGADADAEAQMKLSLSVEFGAAICRSNLEPNFCLGTEISFFRILHFLSAAVGAKKLFGTPSRRIPNLFFRGSSFSASAASASASRNLSPSWRRSFFSFARFFFARAIAVAALPMVLTKTAENRTVDGAAIRRWRNNVFRKEETWNQRIRNNIIVHIYQ